MEYLCDKLKVLPKHLLVYS